MAFEDESQQDERRREKFSRERGGAPTDYPRRSFNTSDSRIKRGDFTNGIGAKRSFRDGMGDDVPSKRSKFDGAVDAFEPQFVRNRESDSGSNATLLTFKKYLATQDESLSEEEAISKYNEYKAEYMRTECDRYFQTHKEEEWFKFKYHPEQSRATKEEQRQNMAKRLEVFREFETAGRFSGINIQLDCAEQIIRLMDAVVVKLEGGSDADIEAIKDEYIEDDSVLDLKCSSTTKSANKTSTENAAVVDNSQKDQQMTKTNGEEATQGQELGASVIPNKAAETHQLHKTCSIHFRSIPAAVPMEDIEALCKQHPGFTRLAITDPAVDFRGQRIRSAWATFRRDVNIKEIFLKLKSSKLMGMDLGASVNRDLKRRVRCMESPAAGFGSHRPIVQNDIRQAAKLIVLFDLRAGFYREEEEEGEEQGSGITGDEAAKLANDLEGAVQDSRNPLLANVMEYLVEESNAEEEALVERAISSGNDGAPTQILTQLEENPEQLKVLDRLLLYLRIVHSVDFYGAVEYQMEDQMPNRMGLFHVRSRVPADTPKSEPRGIPMVSRSAVEAHIATSNERMEKALLKKVQLCETELQKLGKKDAEKAVEEFYSTNTQQLAADKWLCPLSGKKFKAPEFVHKHISTKYKEDVDKVRDEALYFNNYLTDPNRPHNPLAVPKAPSQRVERSPSPSRQEDRTRGAEPPAERAPYQRSSWGGDRERFSGGGGMRYGGGRPYGYGAAAGNPRPHQQRPFFAEPLNELGGGRNGGRDPRAPASYRDLDAPIEDIL